MADLGNKLNLVDVAKMLDPSGNIAPVAEILNESNPIIEDIPWKEGNLPTGHRITQRASIPQPTWRRLNSGVRVPRRPPNRSTRHAECLRLTATWTKRSPT